MLKQSNSRKTYRSPYGALRIEGYGNSAFILQIERNGEAWRCVYCGQMLVKGDAVKALGSPCRRRHAHLDCYEERLM
jgi:hypothetical protein